MILLVGVVHGIFAITSADLLAVLRMFKLPDAVVTTANFVSLIAICSPVTIYLPLDLWQPAIGMGHLVA